MTYSALHLFNSLLDEGLKRICVELSLSAQAYVRDLLIYFISSDNLFEPHKDSGQRNLKTLAETYLKAQEVSENERICLLRKVGDQSLYFGGFFKKALSRRLVNIDYYLSMGQSAYESLATHSHTQREVFEELSFCFSDMVNVLEYISQKNSIQSHKDLLYLFKNYLETGSTASKCQLEDHGIYLQEMNHKLN